MIRKTGLIRTMQEAQALYASEIKRVKDLVNRYLPDPRVFDVSVPSQRLPDGLMVFKPAIYAKDGKTVTTEASIEIIPHVNEIYVYDQFQELDAELRLDWKLRLLEQFTEEWFYEKFSKELITAMALIQRVRKNEQPKTDYSIPAPDVSSVTLSAYDGLKALADGLDTTRMGNALRSFIGGGVSVPHTRQSLHWDPKEIAQGFSPTIDFHMPSPPDIGAMVENSKTPQELPETNQPSESEKPFFFTDVKQIKVKKEKKKKKSEKTKSSKSKRK